MVYIFMIVYITAREYMLYLKAYMYSYKVGVKPEYHVHPDSMRE